MTGCNACRLFFALAKHAFGKWSLFLLGLPILYIVQIRFLFFSAPDFLANRYEELVGFEFLIGLALNAVFLATFAAIGLFCRKVVAANSVEIGDAGL